MQLKEDNSLARKTQLGGQDFPTEHAHTEVGAVFLGALQIEHLSKHSSVREAELLFLAQMALRCLSLVRGTSRTCEYLVSQDMEV